MHANIAVMFLNISNFSLGIGKMNEDPCDKCLTLTLIEVSFTPVAVASTDSLSSLTNLPDNSFVGVERIELPSTLVNTSNSLPVNHIWMEGDSSPFPLWQARQLGTINKSGRRFLNSIQGLRISVHWRAQSGSQRSQFKAFPEWFEGFDRIESNVSDISKGGIKTSTQAGTTGNS